MSACADMFEKERSDVRASHSMSASQLQCSHWHHLWLVIIPVNYESVTGDTSDRLPRPQAAVYSHHLRLELVVELVTGMKWEWTMLS